MKGVLQMKKRLAALCLAFALLLGGCQLIPNEYVSVSPHAGSFSQPQEEAEKVNNYTELKNALLSLVESGVEEAVLTADAYQGDLEVDYAAAAAYVTQTNPAGAYLLNSIQEELVQVGGYYKLTLQMNYRRTPTELATARVVRNESDIRAALKKAVTNCSQQLLLRVSGYVPMDFEAMAEECFNQDLTTVMAQAQVRAEVFPDQGYVRLVELTFTYPRPAAELKVMQSAVNTIMSSAYGYVSYGQSELEKASLLYSFLAERHDYVLEEAETPAYALLCEGVADSWAFAAVYTAMCSGAGIKAQVVRGAKNGEAYDWVILELDTGVWHADPLADEQNGLRTMQLLTDEQMLGYEWDTERYPACPGAPEPEPAVEAPAEAPPKPAEPVPGPEEPEQTEPLEPELPPEENSGETEISP